MYDGAVLAQADVRTSPGRALLIMSLAYLSLGSNLGDRESRLKEALSRLQEFATLIAVSSFYETEPVEFADQPWFLNCAAVLETDETAQELMQSLLALEKSMGRRRGMKNGPRSIDLDIVLFDGEVIDTPALTVPHPLMHQRRFVLDPMAEIAFEIQHPILKKSMGELRAALTPGQQVRKYAGPPVL